MNWKKVKLNSLTQGEVENGYISPKGGVLFYALGSTAVMNQILIKTKIQIKSIIFSATCLVAYSIMHPIHSL